MVIVALDIGHGSDTYERTGGKGVQKGGSVHEEHDFNADVVLRLKKILEEHGVEVWLPQKPYTREVSLSTRTKEANKKRVDLYWSVHGNAGGGLGVCAFYWHTSANGRKLAYSFADEMKRAGFPIHGRGVHASKRNYWTNLHVTRETSMVAVLTENGFMDNDEDFLGMFGERREVYRQRVAETHAKVICDYFQIEYKGGSTSMNLSQGRRDRLIAILEQLAEKDIIHEKHAKEMQENTLTEANAIYVLYEIYARELLK